MPDPGEDVVLRRKIMAGSGSDVVPPIAAKRVSILERVYGVSAVRKGAVLALLALAWELCARATNNELLLPTFVQTNLAFINGVIDGEIPLRVWTSLRVLLVGYAIGIALAAALTAFGVVSRIGRDFLETLTAMFQPLPAIALLPIALLWFGLGDLSLLFVIVHSVLWAVALNMHSGFQSVSETLRMVGRNYGLTGVAFVRRILLPAALPSILTGLKIGWAFAWRTLIASELVFGVSSGSGGLGWYIYENKNELEISKVFAGLFTVVLIGLVVENLIFKTIERRTVRVWGMQN